MAKRLIKPEPWKLNVEDIGKFDDDRTAKIQGDLVMDILDEYEHKWGANKLKKLFKHILWVYDISGEYYMLEDDDEVDQSKRKTSR